MSSKKHKVIENLRILSLKVDDLGRFKGKADLMRKIERLSEFIRLHYVENHLCDKLLKSCKEDYEEAKDMIDEAARLNK